MSEPECRCPMARNGAIEHQANCAWQIWKKTGKITPEKVSFEEERRQFVSEPKASACTEVAVTYLIVRSTLRMAGPVTQALYDSIRLNGLFNPIEVKSLHNGYYEIVNGVERFKAVVLLGHKQVGIKIV